MSVTILHGDCRETLKTLPDESVHACVTSPPYWGLRDYGTAPLAWPAFSYSPMAGLPACVDVPAMDACLGLEPTPEAFVGHMVLVFREVHRVLRDDGTLWLNLGDTYATGAGKVGDHPGGGAQGAAWRGSRGGHEGKHAYSAGARGTGSLTQPNRMPLAGLKPKDLIGIPWRVALALQADGWWLRQDVIWNKLNPMPESSGSEGRCTKAHEYIFLLAKARDYYFDFGAIQEEAKPESADRYNYAFGGAKAEQLTAREAEGPGTRTRPIGTRKAYTFARSTATQGKPGAPDQHREDREPIEYVGARRKRSVWTVATQPFAEAHFATFPPALIKPCILAGAPQGGTVLDPFGGSGTTGLVADQQQRSAILCELNADYVDIARRRVTGDTPLLTELRVA